VKKLDIEGKSIPALDANGDPILDDDGNPMVLDDDGNPMVDENPEEDDPEIDSRFSRSGKIEYRAASVRAIVLGGTEEAPPVKVLEGRAIVFDTPTPTFEDWDGNQWYEQIHHEALDGVEMSNVVLKYNHSMHVPPFASTKAGTLDLKVDSKGLGVTARMANTTQASDMHELVRTGELDKMSFAFLVDSDDYNYKTKTRTIFKFATIFDVSIVDFPAYEETSVTSRKQFNAKMEVRRKEARQEKEKKSQQKQAEESKLREAEARALELKEQEIRGNHAKEEQRKKLILRTFL